MTRWLLILSVLTALTSCHDTPNKPPASDSPAPAPPRIGALMVETGHRFELAGMARSAGRWELATYEVGEIAELFDVDVSRALLPGACDDDVSEAMFSRLLDEELPALKQAADERDDALFAERYRLASVSCNTCHATCAVGFIEIPDAPGHNVPRLNGPLE